MEEAHRSLARISSAIPFTAPEIMSIRIADTIGVFDSIGCLYLTAGWNGEAPSHAASNDPRAEVAFRILRNIEGSGQLTKDQLRALVEQFVTCGWLRADARYKDPA